MNEKRFQKRYIEKNNKVYDTWKEMFITDELNSDSLLNVLSHLNGLGEMIDVKIEQGKYCIIKYKELADEKEQLKQQIGNLEHTRDFCADVCADCKRLEEENEQLKKQNEMLRTNVGKLTDDVKYLRNLPSTHQKENKQLKQQCKDFMEMLDDMCIAYLVNDGLEEILDD